jgi:hypothetical protein
MFIELFSLSSLFAVTADESPPAAYALKNLSIAGSPMPKAAVSPAGIIRKKSKCL